MSRMTFNGRMILDDTAESRIDLEDDVLSWPWEVRQWVDSTMCSYDGHGDVGQLLKLARRLSERRMTIGGH